jgi:hypothetical protein
MNVTEMKQWFIEMERTGYGDVEVFMEVLRPVRQISIRAIDGGRTRIVELSAEDC